MRIAQRCPLSSPITFSRFCVLNRDQAVFTFDLMFQQPTNFMRLFIQKKNFKNSIFRATIRFPNRPLLGNAEYPTKIDEKELSWNK